MQSSQEIIDKKCEILDILTNCFSQGCEEALEEAKKLFTKSELQIITKKLNLTS